MSPESATPAPLVWVLQSDKPGDNRQALCLAQALRLPFVTRRVLPLPRYVKGKPFSRPSIAHIDRDRSDPLEPPWPDAVITIGRRPTMVALWIRRRSGNRTRLIMIGRQPRQLDDFALVIASSQYITANDPRILRIALPLDDAPPPATSGGSDELALLIGGPTRTFRLDVDAARTMSARAAELAGAAPWRVLTGRRTPPEVVDWLRTNLPPRCSLHAFMPGAAVSSAYAEALAQCGRFIVTGDSISMVCDVVRAGKALAIQRLPFRNGLVRRWHAFVLAVAPPEGPGLADGLLARLVRRAVDARLFRLPRSFDAFYAFLARQGCAADAADGFLPNYRFMPAADLETAAARARSAILGSTPGGGAESAC